MDEINNDVSQSSLFFLSSALLIIAPLFRAGNRPLPLLVLELLGLALLLVSLWNGASWGKIPKMLKVLLISVLITPLFYLVPLGEYAELFLFGRELYHEVTLWVLDNSSVVPPPHTMSLIPNKTLDAFLTLIPVAAIFIATLSLSIKRVKHLCYIFLAIATFQALLGIAQTTLGSQFFYFGMERASGSQGSYPNRNHFSALFELALPITIALLAISFVRNKNKHHSTTLLERLSSHEALIFSSLAILMLLAAIFSRSRAGILLVMLGVIISLFSFAKHIGGKQSAGMAITLSASAIGIAFSIGIIPLINRFIGANPLNDGRTVIFERTIDAIQQFFPFGSGPGTFSSVYRAFQPIDQKNFINNAHNDYLELFLETGIIGASILVLFFTLYVLNWKTILESPWLRLRYIQMGAGIGMFLMLLHGLVEFNFHIPANMLFFSFLAGLFFHSVETVSTEKKGASRRHRKGQIKLRRRSKKSFSAPDTEQNYTNLKDVKNPFFKQK